MVAVFIGSYLFKLNDMDKIKEKKFTELANTYRKTNKFSDKIKMHTYAINECKMYMNDPMLEEDILAEVIKLEEKIDLLEKDLATYNRFYKL